MIWAEVVDGGEDVVRVDFLQGWFKVIRRKDTVGEIWFDDRGVFGKKCVFHGAWAWVSLSEREGAMGGLHSHSEELGAQQVGVKFDRKLYHLLMKMAHW